MKRALVIAAGLTGLLPLGCSVEDPRVPPPTVGPAIEATPAVRTIENALRPYPCDLEPESLDRATASRLAQMVEGDNALEREVHDCQRLLIDGEYRPLVAIYPDSLAMERSADEFEQWVAVATIHNWGDMAQQPVAYDPLHIQPGLNCLYLQHQDGHWRALLHSAPDQCEVSRPTEDAAFALTVREQTYVGPPPSGNYPIYPRTARFGWDAENELYYLGIKCGAAWCSVGQAASVAALPAELEGSDPLSTVPGYFDEQPLAVVHPSGRLIQGPVGRIYPTHELQRANEDTTGAAWNDHVYVAEIEIDRTTISDPLAKAFYVRKFGLGHGMITKGYAGAGIHMRVPTDPPPSAFTRPRIGGSDKWAAEVTQVGNTAHAADGAVRWRYMDTDAAAWIPCKRVDCCTGEWAM